MIKSICRYCGVGITAIGAGALLVAGYSLPLANPEPIVREVQPTANFSFQEMLPWVVAPSPATSTAGVAAVSAAVTDTAAAVNGTLETVNRLGPLSFDLNSLRSFSAAGPPPGSTAGTANYTQMDEWVSGIAGLASSTGAIGFTDNAVSYDPYVATHAGVLQTANRLGPLVFDLNVLKAIGFTQAPTGQTGINGQPDNFSSVDIGRWTAGIPGIITNSGTTGFVTYQDFANGPFYDYRVGGLSTTTQIGPMSFGFNFLPFISTGILLPPTLSFGLSPNMTAANTPFLPFTPPTPGIVQPNGGLPVPPAVVAVSAPVQAPAPAAPLAADEAQALDAPAETTGDVATTDTVDETTAAETPAPETPAVTPETDEVTTDEPAVVIPGVNGAPLDKPSTTPTSGSGGRAPFTPFKPFTDAISNGIGALTGNRFAAPGGAGTPGGADAGGTSGTGSESGGDAGSDAS
jgi:hypothetical protein